MQIVNGCQTAMSLALADQENNLAPDVRVLVRIYETDDPDLVSQIVRTTNNQNKITNRNLRANDSVHIDMEKAFETRGFRYERKPKQFDNEDIDLDKLFTNESVAQWFLAVVLSNPAGRTRPKNTRYGANITTRSSQETSRWNPI